MRIVNLLELTSHDEFGKRAVWMERTIYNRKHIVATCQSATRADCEKPNGRAPFDQRFRLFPLLCDGRKNVCSRR